MTLELYNAVINPICQHCAFLGNTCLGVTIKDWEAAKNCKQWELGERTNVWEKLSLINYLIGSDINNEDRIILNNV